MHRPLKAGGRPVVVRSEIVGLAHSDHEVVEFRAAPVWRSVRTSSTIRCGVEWKGGRAHEYETA
ncbi:hypothetical protein [Streptomyces mirabilis]|uniref:hypothetical protein n=1 Tax=Streptomyces mirabilis TaxID=68239 RepID=UPI0038B5018E